MIWLDGVSYTWHAGTPWARPALEDVRLRIAPGERVLLAGRNGSGKSTLAWILAGLLEPTTGIATIDDRALHSEVGAVGIAFQHARLQLFRPEVGEDVGFGTTLDPAEVDECLALVGLDPATFRNRRIDELSGGEVRRIAIAGLLARAPRALVLDEPLAGLDLDARTTLVTVLRTLQAETTVATVLVSHDFDDAQLLADRVLVLDRGRVAVDESYEAAVAAGAIPAPRTTPRLGWRNP